MNAVAAWLLALVLAFGLGLGGGLKLAHEHAQATAYQDVKESVAASAKATEQLGADLQAAQSYARTLERKASHVQAVVCPAATPASGGGDADVHLTAGAVSVWNSALTGADVPFGACGAADPTAPACAAATEVSVIDAGNNQRDNAALCREDRLRYRQLIDYLRKEPKR